MSQFSLISLLDNIGFAFNMTVAVGNPFRFLYTLLLLENGVFGGIFFNPYLGMLSDFLFDLKSSYLLSIVFLVLESLALIVPLLIGIAYTTLLERKLMAGIQRRRGPNVVGIYGLLQPLADGLKLFLKETVVPNNANAMIFIFSPLVLSKARQRQIDPTLFS